MQFVGTNDQIGIKDSGVSTGKIAALAVTGAKIAETTITPTKLSAGAPAWTATTLNVANSLDFSTANSTATAGTYGRAATTGLITVTMNGHGMVTGNVALLNFEDVGGVSGTDGSYAITRIDDNSFTVVDTAASPTAIAAGTAVSRTNYYGNSTVRGSESVAGNLSVTGALSVAGGLIKPITFATAQSPTANTVAFVDFNLIPSYVRRITLSFSDLSGNGTSQFQVRLATSSGVETSGYVGLSNDANGGNNAITNGFQLGSQNTSAAANTLIAGSLVIYKPFNENTWFCVGGVSNNSGLFTNIIGTKTLSSTLTGVRITTSGGVNLIDSGKFNIMYE
jgi:hypothetical protein